jgi:hypothetical protein
MAYAVEYATNLAAGFTGVLQSNLVANPPFNTSAVPVSGDSGFYRVRLE